MPIGRARRHRVLALLLCLLLLLVSVPCQDLVELITEPRGLLLLLGGSALDPRSIVVRVLSASLQSGGQSVGQIATDHVLGQLPEARPDARQPDLGLVALLAAAAALAVAALRARRRGRLALDAVGLGAPAAAGDISARRRALRGTRAQAPSEPMLEGAPWREGSCVPLCSPRRLVLFLILLGLLFHSGGGQWRRRGPGHRSPPCGGRAA
mmetsp:Transcript_81976/g.237721  ORF Transcript_81976/g.237721 Transcript_81976/m.237721 type:complete len:210 (+) Transcript_81976:343-972(+)